MTSNVGQADQQGPMASHVRCANFCDQAASLKAPRPLYITYHASHTYLGDIVEGEIEVLQLLHVMQMPHLTDYIILKIKDLQSTAVAPERLIDRLKLFLR